MCSKFKINYFSPIMKKPFKQNYCFQEAKALQNGTLGVKKKSFCFNCNLPILFTRKEICDEAFLADKVHRRKTVNELREYEIALTRYLEK